MKKTVLILAAVAAVAAAVVVARRAREARLAAAADEEAWPSTWPEEWADATVVARESEAPQDSEPTVVRRKPAAKRASTPGADEPVTETATPPATPEG